MRRVLQICMVVVVVGACAGIPFSFVFSEHVPRTPALIVMDAIHDLDGRDRLTPAQQKVFLTAVDACFVAQHAERLALAKSEAKIWALVAALALLNLWTLRRPNRPDQ